MKRTDLMGGCYILGAVAERQDLLLPVIGRDFGAKHLSQYVLDLSGSPSPIYAFGTSDVILFAVAGSATVNVSGKTFEMPPESGLYVRPGEAFQVAPKTQKMSSPPPSGDPDARLRGHDNKTLRLLITVCPEGNGAQVLEAMPDNFDAEFPDRLVEVDPAKKEAMGERFVQVLVSHGAGSRQVTQFIGEIPLSQAPSHHHLYEEALYVIEGEGFLWTEDVKAAVKPGSIIFLPKRQQHSLECTSNSGLRVAGHFYPAGSSAENY